MGDLSILPRAGKHRSTTMTAIWFIIENCNDQGVCDLVNCQHGGQCIVQKDENPTCLCPLGYAGHFCETPLDLQVSFFLSFFFFSFLFLCFFFVLLLKSSIHTQFLECFQHVRSSQRACGNFKGDVCCLATNVSFTIIDSFIYSRSHHSMALHI